MVDQAKIHRLVQSKDGEERKRAVKELRTNFSILNNKEQAWDDLIQLTQFKNFYVRWDAAFALGSCYPHIPEEYRKQGWDDLHKLTQDNNFYVRWGAARALGSCYSDIPEEYKKQGWNDLHRLTQDNNFYVRWGAARALDFCYSDIPEEYRKQGWDDLHRLTKDNYYDVRRGAARTLGSCYSHIPDEYKKQGWDDLIRLTQDNNDDVQRDAAHALGSCYSHIPEEYKKQGWDDLIRLTQDNNFYVRRGAALALGSCYSHIPEEYKKQGWDDLIRLTQDNYYDVRIGVTDALGSCYSHIPEKYKKQGWNDLIRLTQKNDDYVRRCVTLALDSCYSHIPEEYKKQGWNDLIRLTQKNDYFVRRGVALALDSCYSHIPEEYKKQGWNDLHKLTKDNNYDVRRGAADALGSCYSHIPEEYKKQGWNDLIRLTQDKDKKVRTAANHSSGRVSIYRASQAEGDESLKNELETALRFFEKSAKESTYFNPAEFCLPFYRSFYSITFKKEEAEAEVKQYVAEAKSAVEGSKSKEKLLEAMENLGNALKEAQKARDLNDMKCDLNVFRLYCERAANMLDEAEDKAPGAVQLVRKGLPIIDEKIKGIIREIQEKAKVLCKKTKDTSLEPLGIETNEKAKQLSELDYLPTQLILNKLISISKDFCDFIPLEKQGELCAELQMTKNMDIQEKGESIGNILKYINDNMDIPRIRNIPIGRRKEEIIKIAAVQLNFKLSTDTFPPELYDKDMVKSKVINAIIKAKDNGVNILCLPELCIYEDWLPEIKNECGCMILIPGSFYDKENHNLCQIICRSEMNIPPQLKFYPSAFEDSKIAGTRMARGKKVVYIYETELGSFSVLICRDFGNFVPHLRGKADVIFVPSYNSANERFHKEADNHVTNNPSYVIISNTALYGGTSIFGQLNKGYFPILVQKKYRKKDDSSYKLCEIEAEKEGMIIAEFDLVHKSPQLQTTINPDKEIIPVRNIQIIAL